jgi:hypothetical protein
MKSFKTYVKEVTLGTGSAGITSEVDPDFHRIDQEDVRARVNNWLSASSQVEYMNVDAALRQLAGKVEQIGLSFNVQVEAAGESGSLRIPLSQFGEKHDHAGEHVLDVEIPEDLVMSIEYERMPTGGFRVTGQIQ